MKITYNKKNGFRKIEIKYNEKDFIGKTEIIESILKSDFLLFEDKIEKTAIYIEKIADGDGFKKEVEKIENNNNYKILFYGLDKMASWE